MNVNAMVEQALGDPSSQELFDMTWGKAVDKSQMRKIGKSKGTPSIREMKKRHLELFKAGRTKDTFREVHRGTVVKHVMAQKAATMAGVASAIPIIFDPDVMDILQNETPFLDLIPKNGYVGHRVRLNNISARDDPTGFMTESASMTFAGLANDMTISTVSADMKISTDVALTSDFGQIGSQHYLNLRDTNFGERVAAHLRHMERTLLYGNPAKAGTTGDSYSTDAFEGIANICEDQGTAINKASVGSDFLADIKTVLSDMKQSGNAINTNDLQIWCSHDMYNAIEEDVNFYGRIDLNEDSVNYGYSKLTVSGVPVFAGDQIREHTFGIAGPSTEAEGSPGDIFIVNTRASAMWYLAPLSTIMLARIGLAEQMGLFEFSTFADRSDGLFSRYLYNYAI